ncbi:hypothetical protein COCSUDRAFT_58053 [Coccomyxa subellipsoidea C-169]|uniref:Uncharacterized protein n=1 Tax=Coccomyxa subellipsoidea (strain C-169) TaxID=574566 RepID=I0YN49_COCSC|nr:hypothetical protein COCSUDRAFT_58053 [Coccomyxa subellipsoidea C-169]EIE19818.1 hypothetical protein COCSUDRAFT_58053 [Coccomyxa subellipsoidea C-169]|eukprot:XP_005644362.1 hypothetical protein COCSUDRAFT_58053 [Coccomyxa subellipsoidea C-169]
MRVFDRRPPQGICTPILGANGGQRASMRLLMRSGAISRGTRPPQGICTPILGANGGQRASMRLLMRSGAISRGTSARRARAARGRDPSDFMLRSVSTTTPSAPNGALTGSHTCGAC